MVLKVDLSQFNGDALHRCVNDDGSIVMVRVSEEAMQDYPGVDFIEVAYRKLIAGMTEDQGPGKPILVVVRTTDCKI